MAGTLEGAFLAVTLFGANTAPARGGFRLGTTTRPRPGRSGIGLIAHRLLHLTTVQRAMKNRFANGSESD